MGVLRNLTTSVSPAIPDSGVLDDWADNPSVSSTAINGRESFDALDYQEPYEEKFNPTGARPDWGVTIDDDGSIAVSGDRVIVGGDANISTSTTQTVGIWEFDFEWTTTRSSGSDRLFMDLVVGGSDNLRIFIERIDGTITVYTPTDSISWNWSGDTNEHSVKVVSDGEGNYEALFDGTSEGTTSDTTEPNGDTTRIRAVDNTNEIAVNRFEVYPNE